MPASIPYRLPSVSSNFHSCSALFRFSRSFTRATPVAALGAESPKYIEVPQPLQPRYPPERRIKGVLPAPRNIFPRRGPNKSSAAYLAAATPEPTKSRSDASAINDRAIAERIAWKQRMAITRRRNLREGLVELHQRKQKTDRFVSARSSYRRTERQRLIHQKEREDDRLTNPTITAAMKQFQIGSVPDPDRPARIAEKAALVLAKQEEKEGQKRDALHSLYMRARDFITTEAQLNDAIDQEFLPRLPSFSSDSQEGDNIWNGGVPETVQEMLKQVNKNSDRNAISFAEGYADITNKRVRRIAEELTGGKM
ncbi:MAG: hypothetical protein M1827_002021 [Pycnora praestabilis]|nr:MAG: hypothetical protein M1827_002021 [Pycnora praestabilis]